MCRAQAFVMLARAVGATLDDVIPSRATSLRHVRPVKPVRFPASEPEEERMPKSRRHVRMCKALFEMLRAVCYPESTVGWDQFVYFDATNSNRKLAPDGFVKLGVPDHDFDSYLVWEEGTPELAFEILSPSDTPERWTFKEKLRRYRALGVRELIVIDVDAKPGKRLRAWDRIEQDLVERVVTSDCTPCVTLGVTALVAKVDDHPVALRLARDASGRDPVLTEAEARNEADAARMAAEARVAELERALARVTEKKATKRPAPKRRHVR